MTKITVDVLKKYGACNEAVEMFQARTNGEVKNITLINLLIKDKRYRWANWLAIRVMNHQQFLAYAIYAAEQVLDNFEKEYPSDNRPRLAIEVAKKVLKQNTKENRSAAWSAARSAWSAAISAAESARFTRSAAEFAAEFAARSAWSAAISAAESARFTRSAAESAARSAARSAWSAEFAAESAARSAAESAESAAWSAWSADRIEVKILKYGIKLLKETP